MPVSLSIALTGRSRKRLRVRRPPRRSPCGPSRSADRPSCRIRASWSRARPARRRSCRPSARAAVFSLRLQRHEAGGLLGLDDLQRLRRLQRQRGRRGLGRGFGLRGHVVPRENLSREIGASAPRARDKVYYFAKTRPGKSLARETRGVGRTSRLGASRGANHADIIIGLAALAIASPAAAGKPAAARTTTAITTMTAIIAGRPGRRTAAPIAAARRHRGPHRRRRRGA